MTILIGLFLVNAIWALLQFHLTDARNHPMFSSYRSDSLGVKAFYDALEQLPQTTVTRNHENLTRMASSITNPQNTTLFLVGAFRVELDLMSVNKQQALADFVNSGGRLIITLPMSSLDFSSYIMQSTTVADATEGEEDFGDLLAQWHIKRIEGEYLPTDCLLADIDLPLPLSLEWRSKKAFEVSHVDWHTVYLMHDEEGQTIPLILERNIGEGAVVVSADSYFFTNQAMKTHRYTRLLSWLVGDNGQVIFDETIHGRVEYPGVMGLIRRYRLTGTFVGIFLLVALFVWRNAISLVPPLDEAMGRESDAITVGHDVSSGLNQLLKRNISKANLLPTCLNEWEKSARSSRHQLAKIKQVNTYIETHADDVRKNPIETYRTISLLLTRKTPLNENSETHHSNPESRST